MMGADFRTLNYLGSKLRLLGFIDENIRRHTRRNAGVCDLFAGSGCVSYRMAQSFPVIACDVQHYSKVVCNALLRRFDFDPERTETFFRGIDVRHRNLMIEIFGPLIALEETAIEKKDSATLANVIEHGSLEVFQIEHAESPLENALSKVSDTLRRHGVADEKSLISRYYGGVYFSYRQAVLMDVILECISKRVSTEERDVFLAALLSTASDVADTVGKHFAQPIRARDSSGRVKPLVYNKAVKDKTVDVMALFRQWLVKYASLPKVQGGSYAVQGDCLDCLEALPDGVETVYADPPYTREHYSRFYHVLETIALRDTPKVSKTKAHGEFRVSNGIYRTERYQSPFCIRSQAPSAFEKVFALASAKGKNILLSYSPYDQAKHSHPRVVTIEQILGIARQHYRKVELVSAGTFHHNRLNSVDRKLEAENEAELLIVSTHAR